MRKYVLCLFLLSSSIAASQTLTGTIDKDSITTRILIKKQSAPKIISEFFIINSNNFNIKLAKPYKSEIIIEFIATGYHTVIKTIKAPVKDKTYAFNINFNPDKIEELNKVIITAKKPPVVIKNDTVVYNVSSYLNGSERKVEDLLKKLPGIRVYKNTGKIEYKGKPVEAVMLDGDDLFGYNYTIGTKNINIDIVKAVEAIENYTKNPILAGIKKSNSVALNLKLKENKIDLSGNSNIGLGVFSDSEKVATNDNLNLISVSKKQKAFGFVGFNNIGESNSPFSEFSQEYIKELEYYTPLIIPTQTYNTILNENNTKNNNEIFTSVNNIFKFNKKLSLKTIFNYLHDVEKNITYYESLYTINDTSFSTFDSNFITTKPEHIRGYLEFDYKPTETTLLEYDFSIRNQAVNVFGTTISNQNTNFKKQVNTKNYLITNNLNLTTKVNEKTAFEFSVAQSLNTTTQNFTLTPLNNLNNQKNQFIDANKNRLNINAAFIGVFAGFNYELSTGYKVESSPFFSNLTEGEFNNETNLSINNLNYKKRLSYIRAIYNFRFNKLTIAPKISYNYLKQDLNLLNSKTYLSSNDVMFNPEIKLSYKLNRISSLNLEAAFNQLTSPTNYLFPNEILTSNRNVKRNVPSLALQNNETYGLSYQLYNLFTQSSFSTRIEYQKQNANYFANSIVNSNLYITEYFYLNEPSNRLNFSMNSTKYIKFLSSNVSFNAFYSISNSKNSVNNSEIRSIKNFNFNGTLSLRTVWNSKFNFENEFNLQNTAAKSSQPFNNTFISNTFSAFYKPITTLSAKTSFDYLLPNSKITSENYMFLNASVIYKPTDKPWEIIFSAKNILNESSFEQRSVNDISESTFKTNIVPRFYLINFIYNF